ncbi:hypothetical protein K0G24_16255 [Bacteroides thetaiotaomicron]|nr:hypothetical protein [Bacteroides thetaiotaomicron]MCE8969899.1 hypothetical protein [Bacteroides thetaiotaomicron]
MKIKYIIGLVLPLLITSCYEDKGNYDYSLLNDIDIVVQPEEKSYVLGDIVKVTPQMNFALEHETPESDLSFEWTYDSHLISNEKNLNWQADTVATSKELRLAVYDKHTGITYFGSTMMSIFSPYTEEGWLVLSEKDGKSMLTYLRKHWTENKEGEDELECVVIRDVYGLANDGESLGSDPQSINVHYVNQFDGEDNTGWVWVAQKGGQGCVDLSGTSYQRQGNLNQMFLEGSYPAGFTPQSVVDFKYLTLAIGEDGTTYTRVKESDLLYNSGYFLERSLTYEGENVDCRLLAMAPFAEHGGVLVYDSNSSRYFHICDAIDSYTSFPSGNIVISAIYSGKVMFPVVNEKDYKKVPEFTRFDAMKDVKVHYVGAYKTTNWGNVGYMSILEENGKFYLQNFTVNDFDIYAPEVIAATPISQEEIPGLGTYVNGSSKNIFTLCRYQSKVPCLFVTSDNDLYLSYLKGNSYAPVPFAHFDSKITSINVENNNNSYLSVGLENGDFYLFYLDMGVLEEVLQKGPISIDKVDHKKFLWHEKDLGRIVTVLFKNNQNGEWGWM